VIICELIVYLLVIVQNKKGMLNMTLKRGSAAGELVFFVSIACSAAEFSNVLFPNAEFRISCEL
jgi:hypothetical protein